MPEFTNDSRSLAVIEDSRATFDVQVGGRSGTPILEIPVVNGNLIEVTCQFIAKNPSGGFSYTLKSASSDTVKLTRRADSICESSAGWQSCVRTDYFLVKLPAGTGADDATFEAVFDAGGMSNPGEAGSFILIAKIVGSQLIPE